jgi:hypothetical protein
MLQGKDYLFKEFIPNNPIQIKDIEGVEDKLSIKFPEDYVNFMVNTNGGEGSIGEDSYLRLWKIEELIESNEGYGVEEFAPGLIIIGSDGGDTAYGFDFRTEHPILVEVGFIGMDLEEPYFSASSFIGFIEYLYNR